MAENLKGVFERSMRRTFRVYLEPAAHRGRRRETWGESTYDCEYAIAGSHVGQRNRKRGGYGEVRDRVYNFFLSNCASSFIELHISMRILGSLFTKVCVAKGSEWPSCISLYVGLSLCKAGICDCQK